ncbi:hypothetical protein Tco_0013690 [Tanacetum coccineum]
MTAPQFFREDEYGVFNLRAAHKFLGDNSGLRVWLPLLIKTTYVLLTQKQHSHLSNSSPAFRTKTSTDLFTKALSEDGFKYLVRRLCEMEISVLEPTSNKLLVDPTLLSWKPVKEDVFEST